LVERGARNHPELRPGRQQLCPEASGFRGVLRGGAAAGDLLAGPERAVPALAMADPLRVLCVQDTDSDPLLLIDELERGGYEPLWRRVDSIGELESALSESWDIVIADDRVRLTPLQVLQALRACKLDVPLIVVSGTVEEAAMVEVMRAGAHDYVQKSNLQRLVPA